MLNRSTPTRSWTRYVALITTLLVAALGTLVASPAAHAAPAVVTTRTADAVAKARDCRNPEVRCSYRTVKFTSGSRRHLAVNREIALRPARSNPLPRCQNYTVRIFQDGSSRVVSCTANTRVIALNRLG